VSRLAQFGLSCDALVWLDLTLDSIQKLTILGRKRRPDLIHPERDVARGQAWPEIHGLTDIEFARWHCRCSQWFQDEYPILRSGDKKPCDERAVGPVTEPPGAIADLITYAPPPRPKC
jgi:hypothetical protein